MRTVLHDGETRARIDLYDLTRRPHCYAVGAMAGLDGEVVVIDGAPWVTRCTGDTAVTKQAFPESDEAATLLTAAYVPDWGTVTTDCDLSLTQLERHVTAMAAEYGWSPKRGIAFRVEGYVTGLSYHVIRGACPMRAQRQGDDAVKPYRSVVDRTRAMLVGFLMTDGDGCITHNGQNMHIHVFIPGKTPMAGHVEDVHITAGSAISVPTRRVNGG